MIELCGRFLAKMVREFRLRDGSVVLCDQEDLPRILEHRWHPHRWPGGRIAARAHFFGTTVFLHRFVLPVEGNIRFRDGNPLNVTRSNLLTRRSP